MRVRLALILTGLLLSLSASAESMRCGKWVVSEETTVSELLQKCGEPMRKETQTEDVYARNQRGNTYKTGTATTERWFYQQSSRSLVQVVTIVDGKVRRIERAK